VNARDELFAIHGRLFADAKLQTEYANNEVTALYGYSEGAEHALDTVRALGYVKHRTITTIEELDALLDGTVIMSRYGSGATIYRNNPHLTPESFHFLLSNEGDYATVLYEPEA
jgi:hypothetical protein